MAHRRERVAWDPEKSNYNKRGKDLNVTFDPGKSTGNAELDKIAKNIIDLSVPRGKQKAINASEALGKEGWKKWMNRKADVVDKLTQFKRNNAIAGRIVDLEEFEQQEFLKECFEEYLRMAQLDGRSKTTFSKQDDGKLIGKKIFDMTFEEYLRDCITNIDWRIKNDLPLMKHREEMGLVGTGNAEYDKTLQLMKMSKEGIKRFLCLNEAERFIYI